MLLAILGMELYIQTSNTVEIDRHKGLYHVRRSNDSILCIPYLNSFTF